MKFILLTVLVLSSIVNLQAQGLPTLPTASQVFSVEDVKQYWLYRLSQKEQPPRPDTENSVVLRSWQETIQAHHALENSIQEGEFDEYARTVQLTHNEKAYRELGMVEKAQAAALELNRMQQQELAQKQTQELHQAQIDTLKLQQQAAQAQLSTAQELRLLRQDLANLQAERNTLLSEISAANTALSQANSKITNLENEVYQLRNRVIIPVRTTSFNNRSKPRRSPFERQPTTPDKPTEPTEPKAPSDSN